MKIKSTVVALSASLFSITAFSAVPHTFKAGQVATAKAFNENFQALSDEVDSVKSGPQSCIDNAFDVTYTPKGYIGELITVGAYPYRVVKIPFVGNSGALYHLTKPVFSPFGLAEFTPFRSINTSSWCDSQSVIGDISHIYLNQSSQSYFSHQADLNYSTYSLSAGIQIVIDGQMFSISYSESKQSERKESDGDYDFTDEIIPPFIDSSNIASHLDELIDYVKIEKVSQ